MTPRVRQWLINLFAALVVCTAMLAIIAAWTVDPAEQIRFIHTATITGVCALLAGAAAAFSGGGL